MKLWYSATSPYVRKVLATIKHHHLNVELLKVPTTSFDHNSPHNRNNPLGRIPALEAEDGDWLFNSLLISEYLDSLGKSTRLFPVERRWQMLNLHALVDGIMENTMPMLAERMFRPENEWWTFRQQQVAERNQRSFAVLEQKLKQWNEQLNIATITAVCLIDWWQVRQEKLGFDLPAHFPELAEWAEKMNGKHLILAQTRPI